MSINALKSLISTKNMLYTSKKFIVGLSPPFLNGSTNNLLTFLNTEINQIIQIIFFSCVLISNANLFQGIVLLNPCFLYSKNVILSFIDKVTTRTIKLQGHKV